MKFTSKGCAVLLPVRVRVKRPVFAPGSEAEASLAVSVTVGRVETTSDAFVLSTAPKRFATKTE